jgi:hypothetical protein
MLRPYQTGLFLIGALLAGLAAVGAEAPKTDKDEVVPWVRKATKDLPRNRTGGSPTDKSAGGTDASLFFVAPRSTGLTTAELPVVYWYISEASKQVTFTLVKDEGKKTEIRLVVKDVGAGFHQIDLAALAKEHDGFKPLVSNDWTPADAGGPRFKALYRMAIKSEEPKLLATAYIARVQAPAGQASGDYGLQIKNELWYDAVQSLAGQLSGEAAKVGGARKQFAQLLQAEEVLRSEVADGATEDQKKNARKEEEHVFQKLSVPDPIDLKSDKWEPHFGAQSVPDPIDLK